MACAVHSTGRATAHAPISPVTEARQRVMRSAHFRARQGRVPFAEALRQAWAIEKGLTEEGAQPRQAALREAVMPPPAAALPPLRRSRPTRTATRARRERRIPDAPRRAVTVQLGHAFTHTLQMVAEWDRAGCPGLTPNEAAAIGVVIEACIGLLDASTGDADCEPSLGAPERPGLDIQLGYLAEPYPWIDKGTAQVPWAQGSHDGREEEDEHGGDITEEPHDAEEDEPCLGSLGGTADGCEMTQERWSDGSATDLELTEDGDDRISDGKSYPLWNDPKIEEAKSALRSIERRQTRTSPSPMLHVMGPDVQKYFLAMV